MAIWNEEYELYRKYIKNISTFYKKRTDVRTYIDLGLSLLTITIFIVFAIRPTAVTIVEKVNELNAKKQTNNQLDAKLDSLSQANDLLLREAERLALLDQAIPLGGNPEDYVVQLDALAGQNGLSVEGMNIEGSPLSVPEENSLTSQIYWFPFSITVAGEYEQLFQYLNQVENLRRPIKIESVAITESTTAPLQLMLEGQVPYYTNSVTIDETK